MSDVESMCRAKRVDLVKQYQAHCFGNAEFVKSEVNHWQSGELVIRSLPIETQANYADFVTEHMCNDTPEILAAYVKEIVEDYSALLDAKAPFKCCPIGNLALVILTLTERKDMQGDTQAIVTALNRIKEQACM